MTVAVHDLDCETRAPQLARRWTAECLRAQLDAAASADGAANGAVSGAVDDLIDDAVLCVSELVTNAVHAGCSELRLELRVDQHAVRVAVLDNAPGRPTPRSAGRDERSGRGLRLVEAVARRWGVTPGERGKSVWAEFGRPA